MVEYDPQEKELVKRLDWKLIPILSIYYFCLLMVLKSNQNRSNQIHTSLPNWKSEELLKKYLDIDIDSSILWSIATHSIASVIFVLPSTLLFRKIGPSLWFSLYFYII
jgi:hypothetical protein